MHNVLSQQGTSTLPTPPRSLLPLGPSNTRKRPGELDVPDAREHHDAHIEHDQQPDRREEQQREVPASPPPKKKHDERPTPTPHKPKRNEKDVGGNSRAQILLLTPLPSPTLDLTRPRILRLLATTHPAVLHPLGRDAPHSDPSAKTREGLVVDVLGGGEARVAARDDGAWGRASGGHYAAFRVLPLESAFGVGREGRGGGGGIAAGEGGEGF